MTAQKIPWHLNIRQKVVAGMTLALVPIGTIAALSYHYLSAIERKPHFVEIAEDLNHMTLESEDMRRTTCFMARPKT